MTGQAVIDADFGLGALNKPVVPRLAALHGGERLGETFSYDLEVLTDDPIDFTKYLGTGVGVRLIEPGSEGQKRFIRGVLFESETLGFSTQFGHRSRLNLRPWTELLNLGQNTRIFQQMTTLDIVKAVFKDAGFTGYELKTRETYQPREYCVQWRESDLHFIQRLMDEEGIYTFIQHAENTHILLICDGPTQHVTPEGRDTVLLNTGAREGVTGHRLWSWSETLRPALAKVSLRDQHFKKPVSALTASKEITVKVGVQDVAEFYDYPGDFGYLSDEGDQKGDIRAKARLDASRAQGKIYRSEGDVVALAAGDKINIEGVDQNSFSGEIMLISVKHQLTNAGFGETKPAEWKPPWIVEIEAVPANSRWHVNQRRTKPMAGGPQTAVVVGPEGQTVHVDPHGRVLIEFYWDRRSKTEQGGPITPEARSCWVRVSQAWADASFGHMVLPRIGEEVIVDFLDGDPDRPIIIGRVHNATHKPPYTLPDNQTKSTWKSQSVGDTFVAFDEAEEPPTANDTGFNEFGFEDKMGKEEVFFHAQRDFKGRTRHDHSHKVGRDEIRRVGHNSELSIKNNLTTTLDEGDEARTLTKGSRKTKINKAETITIETGDHATTVQKGNLSIDVSLGKVKIEAMQEILLKVGQNTIKISQQGIETHGLTVDVKADTALTTNGQLTAEHKAGVGMTISGAIVNIN